jgi:hypothetical protein
VCSYQHSDEPSRLIESGEFLDQLSDCELLKMELGLSE